jgi:hypothetical protein
MCRSDTASRENEVESLGERGNLLPDDFDVIRNGGNSLHIDAELPELSAEKMRVRILRFARQNLVPNDDDAGAF